MWGGGEAGYALVSPAACRAHPYGVFLKTGQSKERVQANRAFAASLFAGGAAAAAAGAALRCRQLQG
jgi:hypothetical protein